MSSRRPSLAETMRQVVDAPDPSGSQQLTREAATPEASSQAPGFYAATRVGKKKVTATLAPTDHKRLRHLALEREITTEALLGEAIADLFVKYEGLFVGKGANRS